MSGVLASGKPGDARQAAEWAMICLEELEKQLNEDSKH